MNTEALFLFLILLLGLVLCSFLGGDCNREGFIGKFFGIIDVDDDAIQLKRDNMNVSGASAGAPTNYDNYNHYTGNYSNLLFGSTYYGPNGSSIFVQTNTDGTQKLKVLLPGTSSAVMFEPKKVQDISSNTVKENYTNYSSYVASTSIPVFYGPNGAQASVVVGPQGEQAIKVDTTSGTYYYSSLANKDTSANQSTATQGTTSQGAASQGAASQSATSQSATSQGAITSTQYFGATGSPIQTSQAASAYQTYTPHSTVSAPITTTAASALPTGIPKSQIPPGQEDLYILKTEVVPPVCPVCPTCPASPALVKQETCPPCPACARCPEPAFECKKVPNYNAMNGGQYAMPAPVLNDFSQFGM